MCLNLSQGEPSWSSDHNSRCRSCKRAFHRTLMSHTRAFFVTEAATVHSSSILRDLSRGLIQCSRDEISELGPSMAGSKKSGRDVRIPRRSAPCAGTKIACPKCRWLVLIWAMKVSDVCHRLQPENTPWPVKLWLWCVVHWQFSTEWDQVVVSSTEHDSSWSLEETCLVYSWSPHIFKIHFAGKQIYVFFPLLSSSCELCPFKSSGATFLTNCRHVDKLQVLQPVTLYEKERLENTKLAEMQSLNIINPTIEVKYDIGYNFVHTKWSPNDSFLLGLQSTLHDVHSTKE